MDHGEDVVVVDGDEAHLRVVCDCISVGVWVLCEVAQVMFLFCCGGGKGIGEIRERGQVAGGCFEACRCNKVSGGHGLGIVVGFGSFGCQKICFVRISPVWGVSCFYGLKPLVCGVCRAFAITKGCFDVIP